MFGATGFTGKLVCEYINSKYSDSLNWAIAGRNRDKLDNVSNELGLSVPTIDLDSNNESHVENVLKQTRLILTTVGPYQLYGNEIIKKCAELGVHYVDLSGEPGWMYLMNEHKAQAQQSGAKIVHSCGFDSIPSDLGVLFLQNEAKNKYGKPYANVKCRVRSMKGEFSGGTAASLRATLGSLKTNPEMFNILVDPFTLCEGFKGPDQPVDNKPYYDEVPLAPKCNSMFPKVSWHWGKVAGSVEFFLSTGLPNRNDTTFCVRRVTSVLSSFRSAGRKAPAPIA